MQMETIEPRIINIESAPEAQFAHKFMTNPVTVAVNDSFTAFAVDPMTVFVYSNTQLIMSILQDINIVKLVSKPIPAIKSIYGDIKNCTHISDYIINKLKGQSSWMMVNRMNLEIMEEGNHLEIDRSTNQIRPTQSLSQTAANVALIMMKYKTQANRTIDVKSEKSTFNEKRDCFLLYLTAYNDLLSRYGPMKFTDLVRRVKDYPQLCRTNMNPVMALKGLIESEALMTDPESTLIFIPEQQS
jgi:hypothetical protein